MGINEAVTAIEELLRAYDGAGARPVEVQVHPSGDDRDAIKIRVDLGAAQVDPRAWERACEAAIRAGLPAAAAYRLQIRAERDP